jgi:transcriptional regulator with XRE-family HTH domain
MSKIDLNQQFAVRLRQGMINAGHSSQRSSSGVDIHKLAEMTGYSTQICRKYLRGEALPEPIKLIEISMKLKVSPGWLLFGDVLATHDPDNQSITISKNLLHYIFLHASELYKTERTHDNTPDFLLDLTRDVSHINADEEQSKKIIDLALASAKRFTMY